MAEIHHQLQINAPAETVFDALTTSKGLNSWWTLESSGEAVLDSDFRLYFGPDYDWLAKVTHVSLGRELTWSVVRAMDDWLPTRFGFSLVESAVGTKLRFFHVGWSDANEHFAITNYCWGQLLKGLKDYVESGVIVPFDQRS